MAIHLYLDEALTQQISEGDFSRPEAESYNGTDGDIKDRQLHVANEQTSLASAIDLAQTSIALVEPRFADGELIIIDGEQMLIESGGGTVNLTVQRGVANTAAAAHNAGTTVYSGYDYTGLVLDPIDETRHRRIGLVPPGSDPGRTSTPPPRAHRSISATRPSSRRCPSGDAARCSRARRCRTNSTSSCA